MQREGVDDVGLDGLEVEDRSRADERDALRGDERRGQRSAAAMRRDRRRVGGRTMSTAIQCVCACAVQPAMNRPIGRHIVPGIIDAAQTR